MPGSGKDIAEERMTIFQTLPVELANIAKRAPNTWNPNRFTALIENLQQTILSSNPDDATKIKVLVMKAWIGHAPDSFQQWWFLEQVEPQLRDWVSTAIEKDRDPIMRFMDGRNLPANTCLSDRTPPPWMIELLWNSPWFLRWLQEDPRRSINLRKFLKTVEYSSTWKGRLHRRLDLLIKSLHWLPEQDLCVLYQQRITAEIRNSEFSRRFIHSSTCEALCLEYSNNMFDKWKTYEDGYPGVAQLEAAIIRQKVWMEEAPLPTRTMMPATAAYTRTKELLEGHTRFILAHDELQPGRALQLLEAVVKSGHFWICQQWLTYPRWRETWFVNMSQVNDWLSSTKTWTEGQKKVLEEQLSDLSQVLFPPAQSASCAQSVSSYPSAVGREVSLEARRGGMHEPLIVPQADTASRQKKRRMALFVLFVILIGGGAVGAYYWGRQMDWASLSQSLMAKSQSLIAQTALSPLSLTLIGVGVALLLAMCACYCRYRHRVSGKGDLPNPGERVCPCSLHSLFPCFKRKSMLENDGIKWEYGVALPGEEKCRGADFSGVVDASPMRV